MDLMKGCMFMKAKHKSSSKKAHNENKQNNKYHDKYNNKYNKEAIFVSLIIAIFVMITGVIVVNIYMSASSNITPDKVIDITYNAPAYEPEAKSGNVADNSSKGNSTNQQQSGSNSADGTSGSNDANRASDSTGSSASNNSSADGSNEHQDIGEGDLFTVTDSDKTWTTLTDVNIFEHGDSAVQSDGSGEAHYVIAPGTKNDYTFSIRNNKNVNIKYYLEITGGNDSEYAIPVELEIFDSKGESMTGKEVMISDFTDVVRESTLYGNSSEEYTIKWKWDFERGVDDYDTMLGNTAVEEEIACHININVVAEYDYDNPTPPPSYQTDSNKGTKDISWTSIKTGDAPAYVMYLLIGGVCIVVIIVFFVFFRNKEDEDEDET